MANAENPNFGSEAEASLLQPHALPQEGTAFQTIDDQTKICYGGNMDSNSEIQMDPNEQPKNNGNGFARKDRSRLGRLKHQNYQPPRYFLDLKPLLNQENLAADHADHKVIDEKKKILDSLNNSPTTSGNSHPPKKSEPPMEPNILLYESPGYQRFRRRTSLFKKAGLHTRKDIRDAAQMRATSKERPKGDTNFLKKLFNFLKP